MAGVNNPSTMNAPFATQGTAAGDLRRSTRLSSLLVIRLNRGHSQPGDPDIDFVSPLPFLEVDLDVHEFSGGHGEPLSADLENDLTFQKTPGQLA
jgi:hypothetical protein